MNNNMAMDNTQYKRLLIKRQKVYNKAKNDYYSYMKLTHNEMGYVPNRLGELLCNTINSAIKKRESMMNDEIPMENQYFIFSVPPQHGKSMHITETLPSYYLGKFPNDSVIVAGYNDDFASDFGRKNRDKVLEYGKSVFGIELNPSSQGISKFAINDKRGQALFAGIKGGITGKPANLMIVDDPIKNRQDASSKTNRESVWKEWKSTLSSRIHPGSIVIIIMTRWHTDDLVGRMFSPDYGKSIIPWNYINIPMLCEDEETDPLHRKLEEQVFEGCRLRKTDIQVLDWQSDPESFNSLYQGHPTLEDGNIMKREWFNLYEHKPEMDYIVLSIDATFKKTDTSDYVALQAWGKYQNEYYLLELINRRLSFLDTLEEISILLDKYPYNDGVFIEDKANGSAIIDVLQRRFDNIIPITPKDSKESRVWSITPLLRSSSIYLPKYKSFTEMLLKQCLEFPNSEHDDMVDAMTQALSQLRYYEVGTRNTLKPYSPGDEPYSEYLYRIGELEEDGEEQNYLMDF